MIDEDSFPSPDGPDVGAKVRAGRIACGLSQAQLAERAGLSRKTVGRIEAGLRTADGTREALEHALGMPVGSIAPPGDGSDLLLIGRRFRDLRLRNDLTLEEVAGYIGSSASQLSRFERGLIAPRALVSTHGDEGAGTAYELRPGVELAWIFRLRTYEQLEEALFR